MFLKLSDENFLVSIMYIQVHTCISERYFLWVVYILIFALSTYAFYYLLNNLLTVSWRLFSGWCTINILRPTFCLFKFRNVDMVWYFSGIYLGGCLPSCLIHCSFQSQFHSCLIIQWMNAFGYFCLLNIYSTYLAFGWRYFTNYLATK